MNKNITHDAYDLVQKKIIIMRQTTELLNKQILYADKMIELQEIIKTACREKIELSNQLESVFSEQLTEFTEERQRKILLLYSSFNLIDTPSKKQKLLLSEINKIAEDIETLRINIEKMENTIPSEKIITQYKVRQ